MKQAAAVIMVWVALVLAGCDTAATDSPRASQSGQVIIANPDELQIVTGQVVYVPAYTEVLYGSVDSVLRLSVTLTIHNTDPDTPIIINSVRFYDTAGELVRDYVTEPVLLNPLATGGYLVADNDARGGWGSNFVVEWGAESPVYEPVIEAVMVSTSGTFGVSLISPGRVVSQTLPE